MGDTASFSISLVVFFGHINKFFFVKMQNQAAVEALYSATFVEDYLDCVENLPNDLQRHLSRLREFDLIQYNEFLKDLDDLVLQFENETTASGQRSILAKIQHGLIAAQDIGDDKLVTVQAMSDLIENKSRQLEHDSKILDFGKDDEEEQTTGGGATGTSTSKTSQNNTNNQTSSNVTSTKANQSSGSGTKTSKTEKAEKEGGKPPVKRRKKQQPSADTSKSRGGAGDDREDDEVSNVSNRSGGSRSRGSMGGNKRGGGGGAGGQQIKKVSRGKRTANYEKDDSDKEVDLSNIEIDPDEPTYCLCDQVSYGEMIGCDNDLCPIEWFHFNCVQLASKPRGKWYCPKCRGDKQTVMKPRAQFLKELAIFNKEREAKMMTK